MPARPVRTPPEDSGGHVPGTCHVANCHRRVERDPRTHRWRYYCEMHREQRQGPHARASRNYRDMMKLKGLCRGKGCQNTTKLNPATGEHFIYCEDCRLNKSNEKRMAKMALVEPPAPSAPARPGFTRYRKVGNTLLTFHGDIRPSAYRGLGGRRKEDDDAAT